MSHFHKPPVGHHPPTREAMDERRRKRFGQCTRGEMFWNGCDWSASFGGSRSTLVHQDMVSVCCLEVRGETNNWHGAQHQSIEVNSEVRNGDEDV